MAIKYVTTANTFQQWLIATQDLITTANNLTDGGGSYTFYANTNLEIGNNLTVVGNTTIDGDLTVSGNITLDAVGFDDLHVNGSADIANTLTVTGDSTFSNITVSANATIANANITTLTNVTTFTGASNTAIYTAITSAESTALAFSIALG